MSEKGGWPSNDERRIQEGAWTKAVTVTPPSGGDRPLGLPPKQPVSTPAPEKK